jgi:hypothetical protein
MSNISKYHLIKFILETSYEDHKSKNDLDCNWEENDWDVWLKSISFLFKNKIIPDQILCGLIKKDNNDLTPLCIELLESNRINLEKKLEQIDEIKDHQENKRRLWLLKLENNNKLFNEKELEKKKEVNARIKERENKANEDFISQIKPVWQKKIQELFDSRNSQISNIFDFNT